MTVNRIHAYPTRDVLEEILSGRRIKVVSPFYSPASLGLIEPGKSGAISLITRLPTQYAMPPAFIENDPAPLAKLLAAMGRRLSVHALPELHAKLYINERAAWVGSSNFSMNGFSGKQEILVEFDDDNGTWSEVYNSYLRDSTRVRSNDLRKLSQWISLGLTRVQGQRHPVDHSSGKPGKVPLTFEDFLEWLDDPSQPHADTRKHIRSRARGLN